MCVCVWVSVFFLLILVDCVSGLILAQLRKILYVYVCFVCGLWVFLLIKDEFPIRSMCDGMDE